jgi:hypothetical protein
MEELTPQQIEEKNKNKRLKDILLILNGCTLAEIEDTLNRIKNWTRFEPINFNLDEL